MGRQFIWLIASLTVFLAPAVSRATDPVTKLKAALRAETAKERDEQIAAVIDELTTISHLQRAYFLQWDAKPDVSLLKLRAKISKKLMTAVEAAASDGNPDRQTGVAILIAEIADTDAAKPLAKDPLAERDAKIEFLRGFSAAVQKLAESKDLTIRQAALHALGHIAPAPATAFPLLQKTLQKDELGPRRLAAYAVLDLVKNARFLSRPEAIDTIDQGIRTAATGLKDSDELVRGYSLQAIHESASAVADLFSDRDTIVDDVKKTLHADTQKLFKSMQAANPRLLDTIHDASPRVRVAGIQALVQIGDMRLKIVNTLDKGGPKRGDLWKAFDAADPVAGVLTKLNDKILPLLDEDDVRLRRGAADFLELLGNQAEPAIRALTLALRDSDRFVRLSAARAFRNLAAAKIGDAIRTLGVLVTDPDGDISRAAAEALEALGPDASAKGAPVGDFQKAVHYLGLITAKQYTDNRPPDTETRLAAMKALVGIGGRTTDKKAIPLAELAIPHLLTALFDEDVRIRRAAAETLGRIGRPADADLVELERQALQRALRDEDAEVRLNAASAIVDIVPSKKPL